MNFHNEIFFIVIESLAFLGVPWRTLAFLGVPWRTLALPSVARTPTRYPDTLPTNTTTVSRKSCTPRASERAIREFADFAVIVFVEDGEDAVINCSQCKAPSRAHLNGRFAGEDIKGKEQRLLQTRKSIFEPRNNM
jgi:hypothetical protein